MPLREPSKSKQAEYSRRHYEKNKISYIRAAAAYKETIKAIIDKAKSRPCADCGVAYPPWVMDFDHVRGRKEFSLGQFKRHGVGPEKVVAEIEKCEVVCANCHRQRTHDRAEKPRSAIG